MKKYTYYFADGTRNTIEVEDKWYDILKEMDEAERKSKYNYDRHNKSASLFDDCQRELFEMVYIERRKVIDVAEAQQVSQQAITDRLCRIKKKLQKFLADTLV